MNFIKSGSLYCVLTFLVCKSQFVAAQNLFANPGFEAINNCVEFKADCAPEAWFNIPAGNFLVNGRIAPKPYAGNMLLIVPVGNVMSNFNKPRYVYTGLCCPLEKDKNYVLTFFINSASSEFNQLAVYFTDKEPALNIVNQLPQNASLLIKKENPGQRLKDGWHKVQLIYTAKGGEQFFIFTTKNLPAVEYNMENAMNKSGDVLYFIDEINLLPQDSVAPCAAFTVTTDKLFAYNYRHTNNLPVFKEEAPAAPAVKFINDTVVIPGLLFDVNKSTVKPAVQNILDSLCFVIQQRKIVQINISGHTDSTGNQNNNQLLSYARAAAVKDYISSKQPQLTEKILATGKASAQPVATNTTTAGRQRNRRVQVIITSALSLQ